MGRSRATKASEDPTEGLAFLLSQVGSHSSSRFAERLGPLELAPPHAGILKAIESADGLSQQALGEKLGVYASRLVSLLDELETRGLLERRASPNDRRTHALFLTAAGNKTLERIGRVAREHQDALCAALDATEQAQLAGFLRRIAAEQQLTPGVHPGFRRMGGGSSTTC